MGSNAKTDVAAAAWATPRVGTRLLLATAKPNFNFFFFNLPNSKNNSCRDGRVKDQAELPMSSYFNRDDQALHGFAAHFKTESGEERAHGMDGVPDQAWRKSCLPGHRQADHHGMGNSTCSHGGRSRAGEDGQPEPARLAQGGRRQGRRTPLRLPRV